MKIKGKTFSGPRYEVVVIPRQDEDIVFKAQAVLDYDDHDTINPRPEPPVRLLRGGTKQENIEDPTYKKKLDEWGEQKAHWMFLKSIAATDDLEWETIDMSNPETWGNYRTEMQEAGFSLGEIVRIEMCVTDACGLNQSKIDEATKRFLAGQAAVHADESSQNTEQGSTQSGEPVSASA